MKFNAYIDGFNLYKGALQKRPDLKWLDLRIFSQKLWEENELNKVYFFTSRVKEKFPGDLAPQRQHAYLRALEGAMVEVVLGRFRKDITWQRLTSPFHAFSIRPTLSDPTFRVQESFDSSAMRARPDDIKALVWKYGEKGTDVNLASYLIRAAHIDSEVGSLVVTGDSDLTTPIKIARECGILIKTVNPNRGSNVKELADNSDFHEEVTVKVLRDSQLKNFVYGLNGKRILRPRTWQ